MRLYRTRTGRWVGTQTDARADGKGWQQVEVPTDKPGLLTFLNATVQDCPSVAYQRGRSDAERGMTTNPYASEELRSEWERGHAEAYELGLTNLPSFASLVKLPRDGAARRKARRKAA